MYECAQLWLQSQYLLFLITVTMLQGIYFLMIFDNRLACLKVFSYLLLGWKSHEQTTIYLYLLRYFHSALIGNLTNRKTGVTLVKNLISTIMFSIFLFSTCKTTSNFVYHLQCMILFAEKIIMIFGEKNVVSAQLVCWEICGNTVEQT